MSEASQEKAHRYLLDGRVRVIEHSEGSALVEVQGTDSDPYVVRFSSLGSDDAGRGVWHCTCPSRKSLCAHVIAVKLVSAHREAQVPDEIVPLQIEWLDSI